MTHIKLTIKLTLIFLFSALFVNAQESNHNSESHSTQIEEGEKDQKQEINEFIDHHLKDSYDFTLFSYTNDAGEPVHIGLPLPVILWDEESGLKVFSSSKFHHGETVAEAGGDYYVQYHGKIYKTDQQGTISYDDHHHPTNAKPFDFSITKNVTTMLLVALLMFWLFKSLANSYKTNGGIPTGIGRFFEPIILYVRDEIAIPNIGEKHYKKYMSYLLTIFFFVWFLNLSGLTPLGVNVTGNITVTLAMALMTYFITTFTAKKDYWKHIFWMPGVAWPMKMILAPIELLGTFIKPFALMVRLYANMMAGHVVLMSIIALIFIFKHPVGGPLSFLLAFGLTILELLVAILQAYIFTMLSALYFGSAAEEHGDDH